MGLVNEMAQRKASLLCQTNLRVPYSLAHSRRLTSREVAEKYRWRKKKAMPRGITGIAIQGITATITPTIPITSKKA